MRFGHLFLLPVLLSIALSPLKSHGQEKPVFSDYEYCVTDDGAFGLYKPKGWKVGTQGYPNGRMVFVTDQRKLSSVNMIFLEK